MTSEKGLTQLIKSQIKIEKSTARKIQAMEEDMVNVAAKLFLAEMRFDTEKHAKILGKMLDLTEKFQTERLSNKFWQTETREFVDAAQIKELLETHIKVETKMLEHLEEGIRQTSDEALKMLFEHISQDERKHHKILQIILEKAFKIMSIP
ncbi:MAG: ferritin-like domain-containing protein [Candidatus Bathyarchaeota archaeon]|nr:ferritin-like domain-containing protein [Candidatus Bathyarchaeota archaeon]